MGVDFSVARSEKLMRCLASLQQVALFFGWLGGFWLIVAVVFDHYCQPYDFVGPSSLTRTGYLAGSVLLVNAVAVKMLLFWAVFRAKAQIAPYRRLYDALWLELMAGEEACGQGERKNGLALIDEAICGASISQTNSSCVGDSPKWAGTVEGFSRTASGSFSRGLERGDSEGFSRTASGSYLPSCTSSVSLELRQLSLHGGMGNGERGRPETNLERLLAFADAIGPDLQCKVKFSFFVVSMMDASWPLQLAVTSCRGGLVVQKVVCAYQKGRMQSSRLTLTDPRPLVFSSCGRHVFWADLGVGCEHKKPLPSSDDPELRRKFGGSARRKGLGLRTSITGRL